MGCKFQVGEKVVILPKRMIPNNTKFGWSSFMDAFAGGIFTISEIHEDGSINFYERTNNVNLWHWSEEMMMSAEEYGA